MYVGKGNGEGGRNVSGEGFWSWEKGQQFFFTVYEDYNSFNHSNSYRFSGTENTFLIFSPELHGCSNNRTIIKTSFQCDYLTVLIDMITTESIPLKVNYVQEAFLGWLEAPLHRYERPTQSKYLMVSCRSLLRKGQYVFGDLGYGEENLFNYHCCGWIFKGLQSTMSFSE